MRRNHKQRFDGWRKRTNLKTQYLVDQVLKRIVPEFEKQGFVWYPDFGGINTHGIGPNIIPLQRRHGERWPTVELYFYKEVLSPKFRIEFCELPEFCKNPQERCIQRIDSTVGSAPGRFYLTRGRWDDARDSVFGIETFLMFGPRAIRYLFNYRTFLDSEIEDLLRILPILFEIFDKGIPHAWIEHPFGRITKNVEIMTSWKIYGYDTAADVISSS
jgi:hypothetical protein